MTDCLHLACEVCATEFDVAADLYAANPSLVECPRCGSTDLVLFGPPVGAFAADPRQRQL